MTTTQTGGGNGAAPDGGSGRIMPTRAGWWYAQWAHDEPSDNGSLVVLVRGDGGRLFVHLGGVTSDLRAFRWLAPIPGPEVCAALAEYTEAHTAMLTDARAGGSYAKGECRRDRLALDALHAAIRAERDGAA